jgi:MFS family permease
MQIVALSLLVLQLRHGSALALGEVSLTQALAFIIFAPMAGAIADRFDKRRLLLVTQTVLMALAAILGALTYFGVIRFWMVLAIALSSASVLSLDQPVRFALLPSLVPAEDLMNAIALQSMIFNGASMIGPAIAGLTAELTGLAGNFFLNAASFSAVLIALPSLRITPQPGTIPPKSNPLFASIREGLRAISIDVILPSILLPYGILLFFAPSPALLMPVFAANVLRVGPEGLGLLFSALGLGTIAGSVLTAWLSDSKRKVQLIATAYAVWCGALVAFAFCTGLGPAMGALVAAGAAQNGLSATTIALMQQRISPRMRGRVMSLNTVLLMGIRPLGDYPVSAAIALIGVRKTTLLAAWVIGLSCLYSFRGWASRFAEPIDSTVRRENPES